MASENIVTALKNAKDSDILVGGKYDSDIYRLVYILNRLVEITDLEELEVYIDEKSYAICILNDSVETKYSHSFTNGKDFIQELKRLISVYYRRADAIRTRCMIASSLADYYKSMFKLKLEGENNE